VSEVVRRDERKSTIVLYEGQISPPQSAHVRRDILIVVSFPSAARAKYGRKKKDRSRISEIHSASPKKPHPAWKEMLDWETEFPELPRVISAQIG
jgi:hypothetical protein